MPESDRGFFSSWSLSSVATTSPSPVRAFCAKFSSAMFVTLLLLTALAIFAIYVHFTPTQPFPAMLPNCTGERTNRSQYTTQMSQWMPTEPNDAGNDTVGVVSARDNATRATTHHAGKKSDDYADDDSTIMVTSSPVTIPRREQSWEGDDTSPLPSPIVTTSTDATPHPSSWPRVPSASSPSMISLIVPTAPTTTESFIHTAAVAIVTPTTATNTNGAAIVVANAAAITTVAATAAVSAAANAGVVVATSVSTKMMDTITSQSTLTPELTLMNPSPPRSTEAATTEATTTTITPATGTTGATTAVPTDEPSSSSIPPVYVSLATKAKTVSPRITDELDERNIVREFARTGIVPYYRTARGVIARWLGKTYPRRPYEYRAKCRISTLRDVDTLSRELVPSDGRIPQFLDNVSTEATLPSDAERADAYRFGPLDLWRVDLRAILKTAAAAATTTAAAAVTPVVPTNRDNGEFLDSLWLAYSLTVPETLVDPSFRNAANVATDAATATSPSSGVVRTIATDLSWKRDFCDKIPAALSLLLDANDEGSLLQLGTLFAIRYILSGRISRSNIDHSVVDDDDGSAPMRDLEAAFAGIDDHVVYVKLLMLRRLMLAVSPMNRPIFRNTERQREYDVLFDTEATADGVDGHGGNAAANSVLATYDSLADARFLTVTYSPVPNEREVWMPAMPALASRTRICASNGVCYDVDEEARIITYRREEQPHVNHHVMTRHEDSFYLVDGTKYSMYRAGNEHRMFTLYSLVGSHPRALDIIAGDDSPNGIVVDNDESVALEYHVELALLHEYTALLRLRMYLLDENGLPASVDRGEIVTFGDRDSIYLNVPSYHSLVVLMQRDVYDPLRARLESSWLDIDTTAMSKSVISLNRGATRLRHFTQEDGVIEI